MIPFCTVAYSGVVEEALEDHGPRHLYAPRKLMGSRNIMVGDRCWGKSCLASAEVRCEEGGGG